MTARLRAALLLRLSKCVRVFDFAQEFRSSILTKFMFDRKVTRTQFNLFLFTCFSFFSLHIIACVIYINGCFTDASESWINEVGLQNKNIQERYLRSFYYSVVGLTTTGLGHLNFTSSLSILAAGLCFLGNNMFVFLVAHLDPVMREHNERSTAYQREMRVWHEYRY